MIFVFFLFFRTFLTSNRVIHWHNTRTKKKKIARLWFDYFYLKCFLRRRRFRKHVPKKNSECKRFVSERKKKGFFD